jgi:hypothetical protein
MKVGVAPGGDRDSDRTTWLQSHHTSWRDSFIRRATQPGVTPSTMSDATFAKIIVYISRTISYDVTRVLVVPRVLAQPKGLLLEI